VRWRDGVFDLMGEDEKKAEKITLPKAEYDLLLEQVKDLEALRDKLLRSAADYDNAKKRLAKERDEFVRFSQERLLRDLLPVLDNFERALAHADSVGGQGVGAGIRMIWKQLLEHLTAHGLKRFSSEGRPFDPHFHEALEETEEEGPEGIVIKEILAGYLLHDRVLRPAKVKVRVPPRKKEGREKTAGMEEKEEEIT